MGHSKISTTLDIYTHRLKKDDHEASEAMDAIIDEIPDLKQEEQEKGENAGLCQ